MLNSSSQLDGAWPAAAARGIGSSRTKYILMRKLQVHAERVRLFFEVTGWAFSFYSVDGGLRKFHLGHDEIIYPQPAKPWTAGITCPATLTRSAAPRANSTLTIRKILEGF